MTMEMGGPVDDGGIAPRDDPFALFKSWMTEAEASEPSDPNAMALATAGEDDLPGLARSRGQSGGLLTALIRHETGRGESRRGLSRALVRSSTGHSTGRRW